MENKCANCTGFLHKTGSKNVFSTMVGECRAPMPQGGGTKWASVNGEDGCRDGFKANEELSLALQDAK